MFKFLSFFLFMILVFDVEKVQAARSCKVYGITKGPQRLTCNFDHTSIKLRCINGSYFLNTKKVKIAYHLDVEYGSSPLVFQTADLNLIVINEPKIDIKAQLKSKGKTYHGTCL